MKTKASIIFLVLLLFGCASMANLDTPEKKYLAARAELNMLIEQYLTIQADVPDDLHTKIKTAFQKADLTLDIWEGNLSADYDFTSDYKTWLRIKSEILQVLKEIYNE